LGVEPDNKTLRELWTMAEGRRMAMRHHALTQAALVWGLTDIDVEAFLETGTLDDTPAALVLSPALEQAVAAEEKRIRDNDGRLIVDGQTPGH
jgi:hypothetical protein